MCLILGTNVFDNSTVAFAGMIVLEVGVPGTMVILIAVGLILGATGKLDGGKSKSETTDATETMTDVAEPTSDETSTAENNTTVVDEKTDGAANEALSQREREQQAIDAVNDSSYFESRVNMADYELQSVREGMKHAPKWGVALGLTWFFLLLADVIAATVLLIKEIFVGAIVCAAIFGGVLIATFIVMTIRRARAKNGDISKAERITEGTVKACFMIGTTTTKSGGIRHDSTVRIHSVTYKVIVCADGEEYDAVTEKFYETDEKVTIAVMGKKRAKIVDEPIPEEPNGIKEEE